MDVTRTSDCCDSLGSTPANIATYLKGLHPQIEIYAPSEVLTNWSVRPWYMGLRGGLATCSAVNWSCGFACAMPERTLGRDKMIISMVSKSWSLPLCSADFYNSHFIVRIDENRIMDPATGTVQPANTFLTGGYLSRGWAPIGLDLHIFKPQRPLMDVELPPPVIVVAQMNRN